MILNFLKGFQVDGRRKLTKFKEKILEGRKKHTIRFDSTNRWEEGRKIHFATDHRTNNYNCFKEGVCTGTQKIEIKGRSIYVEGKLLNSDKVAWLAINDGFDTVEDFWWWFDLYTPFKGKIIHWTEIRY